MGRLDHGHKNKSICVFPGGGTQGIISAYLAGAFEKESGKAFHENFTQVEGLSVGALNAAALWPLRKTGTALLSTEELKGLYLHDIQEAFRYNEWSLGGLLNNKYDIRGLEELIARTYGDTKLSDYEDGLHIHVIDVDTKQVRVLKSEDARQNPDLDFSMRNLLRSAIAAPLFFEPVEIKSVAGHKYKFVDGGLFSSDPSFKAYFDATYKDPGSRITLTTFATGHRNNEKITLNDLNGGIVKGNHMLNMLFKSKSNTFDQILQDALGHNYVHMNVDLSGTDIGIVAEDIRDVIPYAERAVRENAGKMRQALNNIYSLGTPAATDNIIKFPSPQPDLPEAANG